LVLHRFLDARSTKDDQEYLFEPAPQYAFSQNQFRIAAHACARTPFYVFMSGQRGAFSANALNFCCSAIAALVRSP